MKTITKIKLTKEEKAHMKAGDIALVWDKYSALYPELDYCELKDLLYRSAK